MRLRERVWDTTASKYCAKFLAYLEHEERPVPRLRLQVRVVGSWTALVITQS